MREIEFRGYSKDDDKWHYGSLVQTVKGYFIMSKEDGDLYPVEENSIGEYTGFIDKNSNKIFEGDIVEYDDDDDDTNPFLKDNKLFYVEWWREECNGWQLVKRDVPDEHSDTFDYMFYWLSDYDAKLCKVIDNTYEERLKDDKSYRTNKMTNKKFAKTFMFTDDCSNEIIKCLEEEVELTADEMFEKLGYKFFSEQASHIVYKKDFS